MNAILLSIGDELVLGQTLDTNSAWLSSQLAAVGCAVSAHITVADDQPAIEQAMTESAGRCDFLIVSGGLGPEPEDDLTRQALAGVLGQPLELNERWLAQLEDFFAQRRRPMPPTNRIQAMIPCGATMIFNTAGTAAGIDAMLTTGGEHRCRIFVVPGVPREMREMFLRDVLPHLAETGGGAVIRSRTLHTFGLGESSIAEKLGDLMHRDRNPSVGTTVSGGVVSLRVNSRFESRRLAEEKLELTVAQCRRALGDLIYGQEDETLAVVVGRMLKSAGKYVATAESCTGGWLAKMLTDVPGSSSYFKVGWITYANEFKESLLGVRLGEEGAVSEKTVTQMAEGAAERSGSDFALAISGIAGPDGGTPTKPVGTVCIALAGIARTTPSDAEWIFDARTFHFPGDREMIRDRAAKMAMTMLRYRLLGEKMPF